MLSYKYRHHVDTSYKNKLFFTCLAEMKSMSTVALNELLAQFELTIKELSETLVTELALRDELEYDKELKNQFISLLLILQKKRRENNVDKKKKKVKVNNVQQPEGAGTVSNNIHYYYCCFNYYYLNT